MSISTHTMGEVDYQYDAPRTVQQVTIEQGVVGQLLDITTADTANEVAYVLGGKTEQNSKTNHTRIQHIKAYQDQRQSPKSVSHTAQEVAEIDYEYKQSDMEVVGGGHSHGVTGAAGLSNTDRQTMSKTADGIDYVYTTTNRKGEQKQQVDNAKQGIELLTKIGEDELTKKGKAKVVYAKVYNTDAVQAGHEKSVSTTMHTRQGIVQAGADQMFKVLLFEDGTKQVEVVENALDPDGNKVLAQRAEDAGSRPSSGTSTMTTGRATPSPSPQTF